MDPLLGLRIPVHRLINTDLQKQFFRHQFLSFLIPSYYRQSLTITFWHLAKFHINFFNSIDHSHLLYFSYFPILCLSNCFRLPPASQLFLPEALAHRQIPPAEMIQLKKILSNRSWMEEDREFFDNCLIPTLSLLFITSLNPFNFHFTFYNIIFSDFLMYFFSMKNWQKKYVN